MISKLISVRKNYYEGYLFYASLGWVFGFCEYGCRSRLCRSGRFGAGENAQFGNIRAVKELSSVANQLGRKRTLCEAYGAAGWELRFEDMKRIGDWLYVLGVNTLNEHLSYVSIRGARKRDHPQSFSYHEPWWDAYHIIVSYFSRLSAALSRGEQANKVLMIEPTTTA